MDSARTRTVAGVALVAGGMVTVLGFVTAEVLYPGYSATDQTISALGDNDAPSASQAVFNAAMVLAGVLFVGAAIALHQVMDSRALASVATITGVGVAGVGVFPAHTGVPHFVAAMLAFAGIGVTALVAASVLRAPFRYVSAVLGGLELVAFVLFVTLGDGTPLGIGGLERWVAYLGLLWATAFGGFLLAAPSGDRQEA